MDRVETLADLKGVGPEMLKKLHRLGLDTVNDLIEFFPRRYDDFSEVVPILRLRPGVVTIKARITQAVGRYARRGVHVTEAVASDASGSVRLIWFNQPYRAAALKPGVEYFISGEYVFRNQRLSITNPSVERVSDFPVNTARIVPIYRETKGLNTLQIRKLINETLGTIRHLDESLPEWIIRQEALLPRAEAVEAIHFPQTPKHLDQAKRRLGFEEVFRLTLAALLNKHEIGEQTAVSIPFDEQLAKTFVSSLPFTLTDDQRRAIWEIYLDMQKHQPMNRLVEGDVGSGKTVVAAMAALMVISKGYQVALMAPTELLARQHHESIIQLLAPLGMSQHVGLLIGGMNKAQKSEVQHAIKSGTISFIIGTHALIQEAVDMHSLCLVIIDEQHRFGVEQRRKLQAKAGHAVHVLSTTATPIPRSLALTLYGELDISVIKSKPVGRKSVQTEIVSPNSKGQLYAKVKQHLDNGRQMFVVCPLIDDSENGPEKSTEVVYGEMQRAFPTLRVGLLHGRLKSSKKESVMRAFVSKQIDILVATTVIEVGVNIPNATIMMIENAERFGLAQAHQLRGRVGRGVDQGYCYLLMGDSSMPSKRLRALQSSSDGFRLAELDLEIRGPGAIYGTLQHGQLDLRIAKLTDVSLINAARKRAQEFIDKGEDLIQYAELCKTVTQLRAVTSLN